jgi:hypothetical protein
MIATSPWQQFLDELRRSLVLVAVLVVVTGARVALAPLDGNAA